MSAPLRFKLGSEEWEFFAGQGRVRMTVMNKFPVVTLEGDVASFRVIRDALTKAIVLAEVAASLDQEEKKP
jgi:hypothetical protein